MNGNGNGNGKCPVMHGGNTAPPRQGPRDRRKGYTADELMESALELERVGR